MRNYEYKDDSLDITPKAQSVKDFIKIKHFCSAKDNEQKSNRLGKNTCRRYIW